MSRNRKAKIRAAQRQRMRYRMLLASGIAVVAITATITLWLQFSSPESGMAAVTQQLNEDALPAEREIPAMIVAPEDTSTRGIRVKAVKPLSLTPTLPAN